MGTTNTDAEETTRPTTSCSVLTDLLFVKPASHSDWNSAKLATSVSTVNKVFKTTFFWMLFSTFSSFTQVEEIIRQSTSTGLTKHIPRLLLKSQNKSYRYLLHKLFPLLDKSS